MTHTASLSTGNAVLQAIEISLLECSVPDSSKNLDIYLLLVLNPFPYLCYYWCKYSISLSIFYSLNISSFSNVLSYRFCISIYANMLL